MNQNAVLMCFNIPRGIKEELIYDLFCNAGPIESIHFGKSGRSVFVVYEFVEAVATAKEIFKDVKLYGRTLRMFDKGDIENIHAKQEEELTRKRRYEVDCVRNGPPMKRRYDEPSPNTNNHKRFYSSDQESSRSSLQDSTGINSEECHGYREEYSMTHGYQNVCRNNPRSLEQGPSNNLGHRLDLLPNDRSYSNGEARRGYENTHENGFRNPYENPVSRQNYQDRSYAYEKSRSRKYDKPYDRRDQRNHHRSHSPPPKNQYKNRGYQNYSFKSRRY